MGLLLPTVLHRMEIWLVARALALELEKAGVVIRRDQTSARKDQVGVLMRHMFKHTPMSEIC